MCHLNPKSFFPHREAVISTGYTLRECLQIRLQIWNVCISDCRSGVLASPIADQECLQIRLQIWNACTSDCNSGMPPNPTAHLECLQVRLQSWNACRSDCRPDELSKYFVGPGQHLFCFTVFFMFFFDFVCHAAASWIFLNLFKRMSTQQAFAFF